MRQFFRKHKSVFLVFRRKSLLLAALIPVLAVIFWTVNNPAIVGASATERNLPIYCVQRDNKAVSLTFDAAWGNEDTETLIKIFVE